SLFDTDALDGGKRGKEIFKHVVLPSVFVGNVVNGVLKWDHRVRFPSRSGRPVEDDARRRPVPLGTSNLLYLVLNDFVCPDPVEEIKKSGVLFFDRQSLCVEGGSWIVRRSHIVTVLHPQTV